MHFRFYGSTMGRFMKPDNIMGNLANPQSWNLYSYVHGNPVNYSDPTGHLPLSAGNSLKYLMGFGSSQIDGPDGIDLYQSVAVSLLSIPMPTQGIELAANMAPHRLDPTAIYCDNGDVYQNGELISTSIDVHPPADPAGDALSNLHSSWRGPDVYTLSFGYVGPVGGGPSFSWDWRHNTWYVGLNGAGGAGGKTTGGLVGSWVFDGPPKPADVDAIYPGWSTSGAVGLWGGGGSTQGWGANGRVTGDAGFVLPGVSFSIGYGWKLYDGTTGKWIWSK
jgi:hypothetical protein